MPDRSPTTRDAFDVLVVGGGINGAGVARDAALRGYRVALVEKDDFGQGSSSRTSKLAHGGIRYLEHGALRLVWEACHERRRLLRIAPHLVHPLPFVFPVYRGARIGMLRLRLGMWLYDVLAGFRNVQRHHALPLRRAAAWGDGLRRDGLRGAALYYDAAMDDARLVLANVVAAREAGALVLNGVRALALHVPDGTVRGAIVEDASGNRTILQARCTVACTGPWTNAFLAALPGSPHPVATTRGTHIVVRHLVERAFTLAAGGDGRVFFVLPWLGLTLVGTTDIDDAGDPDRVAPARDEIDYLLAETNRYFPEARLGPDDVLAAFAGLRPLLASSASASSRSREHLILEPVPGLLAVAGGKYTTYRAVAESVVDQLGERLGRRGACRTADEPLPGGDLCLRFADGATWRWNGPAHWNRGPGFVTAAAALATRCDLPAAAASHLLATHGSRAVQVAALLEEDRAWAAPLCAHHPHLQVEVVHAARVEMMLHLEDWFLRRSRQAFSACHGLDALDTVAGLVAGELGWSEARRLAELESCRATLGAIGLNRFPASSRAR